MRGYIVAGALGMLVTVAFYEGRRGLAKNDVHATSRAVHAAQRAGGGEPIETARQQLADSLMRCQQELIDKEHGPGASAGVGRGAGESAAGGNELGAGIAADGGAEPIQDRTEPSVDEWRELAKKGELRFNRPCPMEPDWAPDPTMLASVGLNEREAQSVAEAYKMAGARASEVALTSCAAWLGIDPSTVGRIGAENCESILDDQAERVPDVFRRVAEVRAGSRSESDMLAPVDKYFLAKTREQQDFEADLARRVGADRAHRITQSTAFCMYDERWPAPPANN